MVTGDKTGGRRRRGFTLLEVLVASSFTAIACTAATMLIQSINTTAASSNGVYAGVAAARDALNCIDMLTEQAALIGYWDDSQVLIWRNDDNGDGQINLSEETLIRYDAATGELSLQDVRFPPGTPAGQNVAVPLASFIGVGAAQQVGQNSNVRVRKMVSGVSSFHAWCDTTGGAGQTVQLNFTVTCDDGSQAFHAVMTLRARTRATVP